MGEHTSRQKGRSLEESPISKDETQEQILLGKDDFSGYWELVLLIARVFQEAKNKLFQGIAV